MTKTNKTEAEIIEIYCSTENITVKYIDYDKAKSHFSKQLMDRLEEEQMYLETSDPEIKIPVVTMVDLKKALEEI